MDAGRTTEIDVVNTLEEANRLLREGWDLYAVFARPFTEGQRSTPGLGRELAPLTYVLVQREGD